MDPATTLGVVSAIATLVDLGIKIASKIRDLRKPPNEASKALETEVVGQQMIACMQYLELRGLDGSLLLLYNRCKLVAEELLTSLGQLKCTGRSRRFNTVKEAYRGVRMQPRVDDLLERLKTLGVQIQL